MKAVRVEQALKRLRQAGESLRKRHPREVLDALTEVLDGWSSPTSSWRQKLAADLPAATGFSRENIEAGLEHALRNWNGAALRELVSQELGPLALIDEDSAQGFDITGVVLAGSIPMPSLVGIVTPLLLRSPVLVKPASRDRLTPALVAASLGEVDAQLGDCVEVVDFPRDDSKARGAFMQADCIVASGDDATVASIAALARKQQPVVQYGHRLSVAILGPDESQLDDAAKRLAFDVSLWDQLGCLSPLACYVVGEVSERIDAFADQLASALNEAQSRWPRGSVPPAAAAQIVHERSVAEMREAAGAGVRVLASASTEWTVIREVDASFRPAPLHRFLRLHPVPDTNALRAALAPLAPHLAGVALHGFAYPRSLDAELVQLSASYLCDFGELQAPPLEWDHGHKGLLQPLLA